MATHSLGPWIVGHTVPRWGNTWDGWPGRGRCSAPVPRWAFRTVSCRSVSLWSHRRRRWPHRQDWLERRTRPRSTERSRLCSSWLIRIRVLLRTVTCVGDVEERSVLLLCARQSVANECWLPQRTVRLYIAALGTCRSPTAAAVYTAVTGSGRQTDESGVCFLPNTGNPLWVGR